MSDQPVMIYTAADISVELGVSPAAVTNWTRRHADTPAPDFITPGGRPFWSDPAEWIAWHEARATRRAERAARRAAELAAEAERKAAELADHCKELQRRTA